MRKQGEFKMIERNTFQKIKMKEKKVVPKKRKKTKVTYLSIIQIEHLSIILGCFLIDLFSFY